MFVTKGDLIYSSKPFAFALFQSERDLRCDQCFKPLKAKIPCFKCLRVVFCSRKCQSESTAQENHSHECPVLASRPLSCVTRIIARVIKRLDNTGDENEVEEIWSHRRDWNCLMDHYENIVKDATVMHEFESVFNDLFLIFGDTLPDMRTVLSIYGKMLINSFAVLDQFMRQIGRAIYLGPSIFDHSCKPSASFLFIGTTIYIKALKTMSINDITDLRITYIDEFETHDERRRLLRSSYYFDCDCERCNLEEKPIVCMDENKSLRLICEKIEHLTNENNYLIGLIERTESSSEKQFYKSCVQNDNNFITELVSQLRQVVMNLNTVFEVKIAEFVAINTRDINLWLKVMDIFRSYYGECHPRLALKLYILAKHCHKYPALKRQLLSEAKTIANRISPDFRQYAKNSNFSRSRAISKYSENRVISDSLINSTLLYLIESELIDRNYTKNYSLNANMKCYESKQRSSVTVSRSSFRPRMYF